jgi:hypothetical protein
MNKIQTRKDDLSQQQYENAILDINTKDSGVLGTENKPKGNQATAASSPLLRKREAQALVLRLR